MFDYHTCFVRFPPTTRVNPNRQYMISNCISQSTREILTLPSFCIRLITIEEDCQEKIKLIIIKSRADSGNSNEN